MKLRFEYNSDKGNLTGSEVTIIKNVTKVEEKDNSFLISYGTNSKFIAYKENIKKITLFPSNNDKDNILKCFKAVVPISKYYENSYYLLANSIDEAVKEVMKDIREKDYTPASIKFYKDCIEEIDSIEIINKELRSRNR